MALLLPLLIAVAVLGLALKFPRTGMTIYAILSIGLIAAIGTLAVAIMSKF